MLCRQLNIFFVDVQSPLVDVMPGSKTTETETLLILHGFPTSSADFQGPVLDALQRKFRRIILLDYPGKHSEPGIICAYSMHGCMAALVSIDLCQPGCAATL